MKKFNLVCSIFSILSLFAVPSAFCSVQGINYLENVAQVIAMAESSGNPMAVGDSGKARGLMQIQKQTWKRFSDRHFDEAFRAKTNKQVGLKVLKYWQSRYGRKATPEKIIYSYNTGRMIKGSELPNWTKKHKNKIYRQVFRKGFWNVYTAKTARS